MSDFVKVAQRNDIPDPGKQLVELEDRLVVLFHIDGEFFCIDDVCTHDGGPLGEGELDQHCIVCPRHGAKFDVRTGNAMSMPATEPTLVHEVKLEGDSVLVKLGD